MGKVHQDQINYYKKLHKESEERLKTANEKNVSQGRELKQKEIARIMKTSVSAVESLIFKSKRKNWQKIVFQTNSLFSLGKK